jgi:hypothetical protein
MKRRAFLQGSIIAPPVLALCGRATAAESTQLVHGMVQRFDVVDAQGDIILSEGLRFPLNFKSDITYNYNKKLVVGRVRVLEIRRSLYHPTELHVEADLTRAISLLHEFRERGPLRWALGCVAEVALSYRGGNKLTRCLSKLDQIEVAVTHEPVDVKTQGLVWPGREND